MTSSIPPSLAAQLAAYLSRLASEGHGDSEIARAIRDGRAEVVVPPPPLFPAPVFDLDRAHGPTADIIRAVAPLTEAHPAAIQLTLLAVAGAMMGDGSKLRRGYDVHEPRIFTLIVGPTGSGRKGTSLAVATHFLRAANGSFFPDNVATGLSSGEGLIARLPRDDEPTNDPRLVVTEPEFANVLTNGKRSGNNLTGIIRKAWDGDKLETLTKEPMSASRHHLGVVAHVTAEELQQELAGTTHTSNGFLNRFLLVHSERPHFVDEPEALSPSEEAPLVSALREGIEFGMQNREMKLTAAASARWGTLRRELEQRPTFGAVEELSVRAAPHVLRLALVHALLDRRPQVDVEHLDAALALWGYCEGTLRFVFGRNLGNPLAERILDHVRRAGATGIDLTGLSKALDNNAKAEKVRASIEFLERLKLVLHLKLQPGPKGGRPREVVTASDFVT